MFERFSDRARKGSRWFGREVDESQMSYSGYGMRKKFYRSEDAVIAGVCGGIAEYFDFSAWGVRITFLLLQLTFLVPFTFIVYIALAVMIKKRPGYSYSDREW